MLHLQAEKHRINPQAEKHRGHAVPLLLQLVLLLDCFPPLPPLSPLTPPLSSLIPSAGYAVPSARKARQSGGFQLSRMRRDPPPELPPMSIISPS